MDAEHRTRTRRRVLLSFWLAVLVGVPFWHYTTRVQRESLPAVPDFAAPKPVVWLANRDGPVEQGVIEALNGQQGELDFRSSNSAQHHTYELVQSPASKEGLHIDGDTITTPASPDSVVSALLDLTADERRRIAAAVQHDRSSSDLRAVKVEPAGYEIVFSLLNGDAPNPVMAWPIAAALDRRLGATLNALSDFANFTIGSQIQLYAEPATTPERDDATGEHYLSGSGLANFINSAEWSLATASDRGRPLNMIVYIPRPEHHPLRVRDEVGRAVEGDSFFLPQFGAVVMHNPPPAESEADARIADDELDALVDVLREHLLTLVGVPELSTAHTGDGTYLRLDGLYRSRAVEACTTARDTLDSIHKVVDQIPNMHVPAHVAALMSRAISALHAAHGALGEGDAVKATVAATDALRLAEAAFFDEKMVSLLYFPDEHKYGVYMPLFGPVFIPLLLAVLREIKAARRSKNKTTKAGPENEPEASSATGAKKVQ